MDLPGIAQWDGLHHTAALGGGAAPDLCAAAPHPAVGPAADRPGGESAAVQQQLSRAGEARGPEIGAGELPTIFWSVKMVQHVATNCMNINWMNCQNYEPKAMDLLARISTPGRHLACHSVMKIEKDNLMATICFETRTSPPKKLDRHQEIFGEVFIMPLLALAPSHSLAQPKSRGVCPTAAFQMLRDPKRSALVIQAVFLDRLKCFLDILLRSAGICWAQVSFCGFSVVGLVPFDLMESRSQLAASADEQSVQGSSHCS